MTYAPQNAITPSLPIDFNPPDNDKDFREFLKKRERDTASIVNSKVSGIYDLQEFQTGEKWPSFVNPTINYQKQPRHSFRKVFQIIPDTLTFNHNIEGITQFTKIYGVVNTAADFRPLPFVDPSDVTKSVTVIATLTSVTITNGAGAPAITGGFLVLEYLKN